MLCVKYDWVDYYIIGIIKKIWKDVVSFATYTKNVNFNKYFLIISTSEGDRYYYVGSQGHSP